jgi:glutaconyl-CoA/methylmalonyl-CoA decarboxylase subunit gamma
MKKEFRITLNGKSYDVVAEIIGEEDAAPAQESAATRRPARSAGASAVAAPEARKAPASQGAGGEVPSPLAGKVVSIDVAIGQSIEAGQKVMTLEAMKMNTVVSAPNAGSVKAIHVRAGDAVEEGQALLSLE